MTKNNTTKKALGSSIFALFMCVMMLIGTTFAWFTDTASTAVNKIQAGTLKVDIVKASDNSSIKGKSMSFVNKDSNADILWEPGVTFKTDGFKIKNDGNLALKYKLQLNGINGSSKLLEVIEFSVVNESGTAVDLDTFEGNLQPAATPSTSSEYSDTYYIQGHMKESAGNEYQGLDLEGIGITVVATQLASEFDSTTDSYDASATYPVVATAKVSVENGKTTEAVTISSSKKIDTTTPVASASVPADTKMADNNTELVLKVTESTTPSNITVDKTQSAETLEVKMEGLASDNDKLIEVSLYIGSELSNLKLFHTENGEYNQMSSKGSLTDVTAHNDYYYDSTKGIVTMKVKSFSPFTYMYDTVKSSEELATAITNAAKKNTVTTIRLTKGEYEFPAQKGVSNLKIIGEDGATIIGDNVGQSANYKNVTIENVGFETKNIRPYFDGTCTIKNCTFNVAESGYAFRNARVRSTGTLQIENCTFNLNGAYSCIHFESVTNSTSDGQVIMKGCTINGGYMAFASVLSKVEIDNCTLNDTDVSCYGSYTLKNCTFDKDSRVYVNSNAKVAPVITLNNCKVSDGSEIKSVCYNAGSTLDWKIVVDGTEYTKSSNLTTIE